MAQGGVVEEGASAEEQQSLEMQLVTFLASKMIHLDPNHLSACHTLPRKDKISMCLNLDSYFQFVQH